MGGNMHVSLSPPRALRGFVHPGHCTKIAQVHNCTIAQYPQTLGLDARIALRVRSGAGLGFELGDGDAEGLLLLQRQLHSERAVLNPQYYDLGVKPCGTR